MDFKSLSSLSENLRSWSADVPLKNPETGEQEPRGEQTRRIPWHVSSQLTSIGHICGLSKNTVQGQQLVVVAVTDRLTRHVSDSDRCGGNSHPHGGGRNCRAVTAMWEFPDASSS